MEVKLNKMDWDIKFYGQVAGSIFMDQGPTVGREREWDYIV